MWKFAVFLVLGILCSINDGRAAFEPGGRNECWLDDDGNDHYWFCGLQSSQSCHGVAKDGNDVISYHMKRNYAAAYPDTFEHNDRQFVCCDGDWNNEDQGKFVEYTGQYYAREHIKELSNGKCTMLVNPCYTRGYKESTYIIANCDQPGETHCAGDRVGREIYENNSQGKPVYKETRCAPMCANGEGYESYTSDTCVECPETKTSGIDRYGTCVQCRDSDEFYVRNRKVVNNDLCVGQGCCVAKNRVPKITKEAARQCWHCPRSQDILRKCIAGKLNSKESRSCKLQEQPDGNIPEEYRIPAVWNGNGVNG